MVTGNKVQADEFLAGRPDAVREIRGILRKVTRRFRLGGPNAEDLIQESLGRVFIGISSGQFRGDASLNTYAERICVYTCLEYFRQQKKLESIESLELKSTARWADPEGTLRSKERHRRNLRALAALPAECRELFYRVFVEGWTYRRVAEATGVSENAIKVRIFRCRQRLREVLRHQGSKIRRNL